MRKNLPDKTTFLGHSLPEFPGHVIQDYIDSGNNGHLYRAYNETTNSELAFKVVPMANIVLENGECYLEEARKANQLEHPSVVRYIHVDKYELAGIECVVFVCDYVHGESLRTHIKKNSHDIDISFIENFLESMFGLLFELKQRNYEHGDLHAGNILVAKSTYDIHGRTTFRVTDFGVRELTHHVGHSTDYLYVASILNDLLRCVSYEDCNGPERYIYNILKQEYLSRHLIETDYTVDPLASNPRELAAKLVRLREQYREHSALTTAKLLTPFDYPNCEQIGNSHLLLRSLYSNRLLGLTEIQRRSNLMLTGPRGCGKTTVFRALSLEYLISTNNDDPGALNFLGIYYRCDDLYFAFPRYALPHRSDAFDVPMHFLIVTLLSTTLDQIFRWARRHFPSEINTKERQLTLDLWDLLGWDAPKTPSGDRISTLVSRLREKERRRAALKHRFVHVPTEPIDGYFGPEVMVEVIQLLSKRLSFLKNRPIYFFIDDYSHPKITRDLQANLNRLLMHRVPEFFFKLSTESPVSFHREDIDGKKFVESREYDLLNLGLRYITDDTQNTLVFLEDLFVRRFKEVENYPVSTLKQLLGTKKRNETALARSLRDPNLRRDEEESSYAGCETIAAMCSGDVHYMIRLVAKMVEEFGGHEALTKTNSAPRIPWRSQHQAIRSAAGAFMESIRTLPGRGPKLADAITAFGNVSHSYILYETSINEKLSPPHQASRIEPYEPLRLNDEANEIIEDLLRYSVLIEDPRGRSRRGEVVPRFYLRRYLIPHFHLTFSRRDSLELENHEIEMLLCNPREFEKRKRLRSPEDAMRLRGRDPKQRELFGKIKM